jgi:hypothetical protein
MKKTIVAAAVAAVFAAPAMADVSISGQINQELVFADASDMTTDGNTDIVLKGSEDLGNGMKASFTISYIQDAEDNTANTPDAGSNVSLGLSGDFGSITIGDTEMWIESAAAAMAANDYSDTASNEVLATAGTHEQGTIQYISPSFQGVKVILSGQTYGADSAAAGNDFDTTSMGVEYSNGPLLVRYATADNGVQDEDVLGVQYTMGDLVVKAVTAESGTNKDTWVGAAYTMGANSFSVSTRSSDTANEDDNTFSVKHALSKQTYVAATLVDDEGGTDTTYVTIGHSF